MNVRTRVIQAMRTLTITGLTLLPAPAVAAPLILNGGFEAGLASWLTTNQLGSDGAFLPQTGRPARSTASRFPHRQVAYAPRSPMRRALAAMSSIKTLWCPQALPQQH